MNHKEEKKIRFGGWIRNDYKHVRRKLESRWRQELPDLAAGPIGDPA